MICAAVLRCASCGKVKADWEYARHHERCIDCERQEKIQHRAAATEEEHLHVSKRAVLEVEDALNAIHQIYLRAMKG